MLSEPEGDTAVDVRSELGAYDLELRGLTKTYGAVLAVDNISLAVKRGEFLSLLGPSGCGKTSTLRLIAGFERPDAGEIFLQGVRISSMPPFERSVNTVFQNYALFPHMTVFENVAFGLRMKGMPRAEIRASVERMLAIVELSGYQGRRPNQLSGGQQQRVALARALVNHPTVLLFDEPLGALDLKVRQRMQIELKRIHREVGITFIYVTHDQEEALVMSDRVAVMNQGKFEQVDTAVNVYERPSTKFVANFVGESNRFVGKIIEVGDLVSVECGGVLLLARASAICDLHRGMAVEIVVRPEKLLIEHACSQAKPGWNAVRGTIIDTVFQGANLKYVVNSPGLGRILIDQKNAGAYGRPSFLAQQQSAVVTWPSEYTLLFAH